MTVKPYKIKDGESLVVYADGSCLSNGKADAKGGWGFVILDESESYNRWENSGGETHTTNNQMELRAAIEALEYLPKGVKVKMRLDSKYVMDGATSWSKKWLKNGWRTSTGAPVKNEYLWRRLLDATEGKQIEWVWVKGHSNHTWNDYVDILCTEASKALR